MRENSSRLTIHVSMPTTRAAGMASAAFVLGWSRIPRRAGGEGGKLFLNLRRAAMRAFGSDPIAGADEDFAVPLAFPAMKFVNWHDGKLILLVKISRVSWYRPLEKLRR